MCLALGDRKLVAAFVLRVACVAFDPDVGELVAGFLLQGLLPEVGIQGRGAVGLFFQPRRFQPLPSLFQPVDDVSLSEASRTSQGSLSWRTYSMKAVSSIRLLWWRRRRR